MRTGNYIDITNKVFGRVTVLGPSDLKLYGQKQKVWNCRCECGKEFVCVSQNLRTGNTTQCFDCKIENSKIIGSAANSLLSEYKNGAKDRGLSFELTPEQFKDITQLNCHYCNVIPAQVRTIESGDSYTYNGIDRKDNKMGYTLNNCVPSCKICNRAKREMSYDAYVAWLKRATDHARNL